VIEPVKYMNRKQQELFNYEEDNMLQDNWNYFFLDENAPVILKIVLG
jgi:hypothetical protein